MSDCELSVEFDSRELMEAIAKSIKVNFCDEMSEPKDVEQVMQCSIHILKSISRTIKECIEEPRLVAYFSSAMGFHKFINEDKAMDEMIDKMKIDSEGKDFIKKILKELLERNKKNAS